MTMARKLGFLILAACLLTCGAAWGITPEEIVTRMDKNATFKSRIATAKMTIVRSSGSPDVKTLKIWSRGDADAYVEFRSPARDKGIKYLKLKDNLYMFLPRTGKVVRISGHLLREGLMDSDFSYEDMLESRALLNDYTVTIESEAPLDGEDCWVLKLVAKRADVSYHRRKIWVTTSSFMAIRAERYSKSGVLLKVATAGAIKKDGERYYATKVGMEDKLKKGTSTTMELLETTHDAPVPKMLFSRRNLMRAR